jgi:hypothetical protein
MTEEFPRPQRPPRDTEASRVIGPPPQVPGDPDEDEDDGTEPDVQDAGEATGFRGFTQPYRPPQKLRPEPAPSPVPGPVPGPPPADTRQEKTAASNGSRPVPRMPGVVPPYGGPAGTGPAGTGPASSRAAQPPAAKTGTVKIGLWGPPASGKTTYLAALPQALTSTDGSVGRWAIYPNNDASTELLINWSHQLINEQTFPEATPYGDVTELAWNFIGDLAGSRYMRRGMFRRRLPDQSEFDLDLIDVSGEAFGHNPAQIHFSPDIVNKALDHLARAQGLLFLFDPITERDHRNAAEYMNRTLTRLARRIKDEGRLIGPYLPHYIAVCITKFDHKDVFRQAREAGLVNYGPDGMPRVLDGQAEELFDTICRGTFWPGQRTDLHGGAMFVRNQLRKFFHPDRIRYYAISSIGYKKPPGWDPQAATPGFQFDPKDFSNVIEQGQKQKILGPIEPINVLEPLIELNMQITGRA